MQPIKAHVLNGRLTLDEPTALPEGEVIELVPIDRVLAGGEAARVPVNLPLTPKSTRQGQSPPGAAAQAPFIGAVMNWTAEITNDPQNDFALYIELLENDEYRGRIELRDGELIVRMYSAEAFVPATWLCAILACAEEDLLDRAGRRSP